MANSTVVGLSSREMHKVESLLAESWPPDRWGAVSVLLAVSGGADSVAMLRAITAIRADGPGRICVAHLNHQLRGRQSDEDARFVAELCSEFSLPCELGRADVDRLAAEMGDGIEAAAREARYVFLRQTAERLGARYVVTAHTADDQAETIMQRIIRGTGIGGLRGMGRTRRLGPAVTLIRPLLGIRREQLVAYLDDIGQPYRTDPSNADTEFTRNRIRHELLPELVGNYNPNVVEALLRLGTLAGEAQSVIDGQVETLAERCVTFDAGDVVRIDRAVLADEAPYIVRELLAWVWRRKHWPMQEMGFAQWELLAKMAVVESTAETLPGRIDARQIDGKLVLSRSS